MSRLAITLWILSSLVITAVGLLFTLGLTLLVSVLFSASSCQSTERAESVQSVDGGDEVAERARIVCSRPPYSGCVVRITRKGDRNYHVVCGPCTGSSLTTTTHH